MFKKRLRKQSDAEFVRMHGLTREMAQSLMWNLGMECMKPRATWPATMVVGGGPVEWENDLKALYKHKGYKSSLNKSVVKGVIG